MSTPSFLTITDQIAEHLRSEILRGRWTGRLPGRNQLAAELGVNSKTIEAALHQLEKSGHLQPQGAGRNRLINLRSAKSRRALRIAILAFDLGADRSIEYIVDLCHSLSEAGHTVFFAPKGMSDLQFDLKRIARMVRQTKADAWIVMAGSREVLEWFASRSEPVFALFGWRQGLEIAGFGPDKAPAIATAAQALIKLGHRRIVLLCRRVRRLPAPSPTAQVLIESLAAGGIPTSEYNLPDWEETNAGFQKCLDALFRVTPPTALIVDEAPWYLATLQYLARHGVRVPGAVSLICTDSDAAFSSCEPPIACIAWDARPLVRRIVNWASNVSRGKADVRRTTTPAKFVAGGTIGPASDHRGGDGGRNHCGAV